MSRAAQGRVISDQALAIEIIKTIIHQGHTLFSPRLDRVFQLMKIILANEISDRSVRDNQFVGEDSARAVGCREQFLRDDSLQSIRQLKNDLALSTALKNSDNSFECMGYAG